MALCFLIVLVQEAVVVLIRHGRGLEVQGQVPDVEALRQQVLDAVLVGLGVHELLRLHDDVGGADCQVAADAPGAEVLHAEDTG